MGMIKRRINPDLFSALVESIIGQQISNKAAVTVCGRLDVVCGAGRSPNGELPANASRINASRIHSLSVEEIQACGMSMRKAVYIKNIADAAVNKIIDLDELLQKSDTEIIASLTDIKGIGVWTAEMLLIFSLMRLDVVSYGDLAIRRGMTQLY